MRRTSFQSTGTLAQWRWVLVGPSFFLVFVKSLSVRFYPMVWIDGQWCAQSVVVVFNALQFSRVLSSGEDGSGDCCRWQAGGREANVFVCLSYYLCYCVSGFVIVFLPSLCLFVFVCKEWIYAKGLSCGQCRLSSTRFMFPKFNNIWVNLIICFGLEVKAVLWSFRVLSLSVWFNIDHRHLSLLLIYRRWAVSKGDRDKVLEWYGVVFW